MRRTGRRGWTMALLTLVARALGLPPGIEGALDYLVLLWTWKRLYSDRGGFSGPLWFGLPGPGQRLAVAVHHAHSNQQQKPAQGIGVHSTRGNR